jgi:hypothetical protein
VRLSIDSTGKTSAHLSADQPQTLDLLQKDSPALARVLRDAGLNVAQDGLNFSLRHQAGGGEGRGSGFARGRAGAQSLSATARLGATATSAPLQGPPRPTAANSRLDIKV